MCFSRQIALKSVPALLFSMLLALGPAVSGGKPRHGPAASEGLPSGYENMIVAEKSAPQGRSIIGPSCLTNLSTESATAGFADVSGAVTAKAVVTVTNNSRLQVYNRVTCALVSGQSLEAFFASTGITASTLVGLPRIIYDRRTARLFLFAIGFDALNSNRFALFAVSTADGTATTWAKYRMDLAVGGGTICLGAENFIPQTIGVQNGRWLVAGIDAIGPSGMVLDIDKSPTLTGAATTMRCFNFIPSAIAAPIVYDAGTRATFIGMPFGGAASVLNRFDLEVSSIGIGADAFVSRPNFTVPAYAPPPLVPQPGGQKLVALAGFNAPSIQISSRLWNVHTVAVGSFARWRLYKLQNSSTSSSPVNMTFTVPSTRAANNDHLFNPSVATGSAVLNSPIFVTATRVVPSLTAGTQGNAAMLVFEGLNASTLVTDWLFSIAAISSFRYSNDGDGNTCNTSPLGYCVWSNSSSTQSEPGPTGLNRAWSWNQTTGGAIQFNWRTRAVRTEHGAN